MVPEENISWPFWYKLPEKLISPLISSFLLWEFGIKPIPTFPSSVILTRSLPPVDILIYPAGSLVPLSNTSTFVLSFEIDEALTFWSCEPSPIKLVAEIVPLDAILPSTSSFSVGFCFPIPILEGTLLDVVWCSIVIWFWTELSKIDAIWYLLSEAS